MIEQLIQLLNGFPVFNAIANVVLLYLAWQIYWEVQKTNGRLIKLETWQHVHEKADDDRHREIGQRFDDFSR